MKFEEWEPVYELILKDMNFDRLYDERAALSLSKLLEIKARRKMPDVIEIDALREVISGKDALVCGKAPRLAKDIKNVDFKKYVTIAADGATSVLMKGGVVPDIIVTDLDGNMEDEAAQMSRVR